MNNPTKRSCRVMFPSFVAAGLVTVAVLTAVSSSAGIQGSGFRSVLAVGRVTQIGSRNGGLIEVDGVAYSTSGATFLVDGHAAGAGQVQAGDVVSVTATDPGDGSVPSATQVTFDGSVQGKVSSVDAPSSQLFVLGQTVHVTPQTTFSPSIKPADLSGLQNGATVEVTGFANSAGDWVATRIESKGQSNVSRVRGSVQSLDQAQHTFYINSLKVAYGSAQIEAALANTATVDIQGVKFASDGALIADHVRAAGPAHGLPGSAGRIQGLVTSYSSSAYFEVDGLPVVVGAQTKLTLPVPLSIDVQVRVTGTFDTRGELVADSVQSSK